jgi:glutaredoxin-related protein
MTKQEFVEKFQEAIDGEYDYIEVTIKMPNLPEFERISNPKANFEKKLEYYKISYNEEMKLHTFNEIQIVDIHMYDIYK